MLPSHGPPPSSSLHKQGTNKDAKAPSLLPIHMPPPLSLPHEQGTINNTIAPLSVLPPSLPLLTLREQGAINNVKAPSLLPSRVLLLLPLLHKQGATGGAEASLSSTGEQGTADKFKAPHHCHASRGQPTALRHYCLGSRHCHHHASKGRPTVPRRRCQCCLFSHEQGRTNGTTPPLLHGLPDVGRAGCVFATNIATNGAASGRTIVQSVICVTVVIPTTIAKALDVVVNKHQHGRCLCKTLTLAPAIVLATSMTTSPINKCCQQHCCNQGNKVAGNGSHQGLLPGCVFVIGVVSGGIIAMVGGV